jgi:hypothetical protein
MIERYLASMQQTFKSETRTDMNQACTIDVAAMENFSPTGLVVEEHRLDAWMQYLITLVTEI